MKSEQFWLVWNPVGRSPTHKHFTDRQAHDEAKRLAKANAGQAFYVLEVKGGWVVAEPPAIPIEILIPF
jgi:hypothetical protein